MTRAELIAELAASHPHRRPADVELIVAAIFDRITQALAAGDRVELRGFGYVHHQAARRTGWTQSANRRALPTTRASGPDVTAAA